MERSSDPMDILRADVKTLSGAPRVGAKDPAALAAALREVAPRPVPSVVISLAPRTAHETARLLEAIPASLDEIVAKYPVKIELRLDALPSFSDRMTATSLVLRLGVPLVLTLRAKREGGIANLTEPDRQRFLLGLVGALRQAPPKGSLIDIEAAAVAADPEGWGQVVAHIHEKGFHVMLSHHDFDATPERGRTLLPGDDLLDGTPGGAALLWKSATSVRTWAQERALLRAQCRGNLANRRAVIMGMDSPVSRLLAPFFGTPLVYAAVDATHTTARGQLPFADLVRTWARWGLHVDDEALVQRDPGAAPADRWALLGRPAWHSLSPAMHNAAARALRLSGRYFPLEIPTAPGASAAQEAFHETLRDLPNLGVVAGNVTVPFKTDLAVAADRLDDATKELGAANTYRFDGDTLIATNTDPEGVRRAIEGTGLTVADQRVLVLGAGGAAVAALAGLHDARRTITNRTAAKAEAAASLVAGSNVVHWTERAAAAREATIIINATSVGMDGSSSAGRSPLPDGVISHGQTVLDVVYVPRVTPLLAAAQQAGARTIDGLAMLLHQGAAAFSWWTGQSAPVDAMRDALDRAARIEFPAGVRAALQGAGVEP